MNDYFDEEEYLIKHRKDLYQRRYQRALTEKFHNDPDYRSKIKIQAERYLERFKRTPEFNSAVREYHQSDEFRMNPVPFAKTEKYRELVTEFIYSLEIAPDDGSLKECGDCGEEKPLDQFYYHKVTGKHYESCKECYKSQMRRKKEGKA